MALRILTSLVYIVFLFREKMLKHTAEINRIQALREANHRSIQWAVQGKP